MITLSKIPTEGRKSMKKLRLILAAGLLMLLTGCFSQSVDDLYAPPRAPDDYLKLDNKINEVLNAGGEYAAPLTGELTQKVQLQDLDGDGVDERIQLTAEQGEYYENYTLLLNDQPVPIEGAEGFETELWIVDIDVSDGQKELCFSVMQDSYGLGAYAIIGWRDGAPTVLADLKSIPILMGRGAVSRKITQEFPGDGTFTVWADTPVYSDAFGCMYVGVPYVYDGVSVAAAETQVYSLRVDSALAPHYAAYTPFKAYSEPGGSLESFTATLGTVYVPDQLALVGGTLYLHVVSEDGAQSGWISEKSDRSAYYEVPPGWG